MAGGQDRRRRGSAGAGRTGRRAEGRVAAVVRGHLRGRCFSTCKVGRIEGQVACTPETGLFFFPTDLFANNSARSQCKKLTEDVGGTEVLEIHKPTGRGGPIRACGWREEGRQTSPPAGRS